MNRQESNFSQGFSLLEVALALLVLGLLSNLALSFMKNQQKMRQYQVTQQHQAQIIQSLAAYANRYGSLPCPASPLARGPERGVAISYCTRQNASGLVPYRTLGLSEKVARDGHLNLFTYAVQPVLTKTRPWHALSDVHSDPEGFCAVSPVPSDGLDVKEGEADSVAKPLRGKDMIAFVLVSHGPSGGGAFQKSGERRPVSTDAGRCKRQNAFPDLGFCAKPSPDDKGLFDDNVKWETRSNFASYYMKRVCQGLSFYENLNFTETCRTSNLNVASQKTDLSLSKNPRF